MLVENGMIIDGDDIGASNGISSSTECTIQICNTGIGEDVSNMDTTVDVIICEGKTKGRMLATDRDI